MAAIFELATLDVLLQVGSGDGAFIGLAFGYGAVCSLMEFKANSSALHKIKDARLVGISDLCSLPSSSDSNVNSESKLVIIRGIVEAKSALEGNSNSFRANVLSSQDDSAEKAVILQHTRAFFNIQWRGIFSWCGDLFTLIPSMDESSSLRKVPFVLVETGRWPQPEYVNVNMDGSKHPLPLVTVYSHERSLPVKPLTFLQAIFGQHRCVNVLDEEKILPLGKDITAVGVCCSKDGILEIKSCKDLPYFLSDMTKDQMLIELALKTKALMWNGVMFGSIAIGILGFAVVRNWNQWKHWWRHQRHASADEETGVPKDQLCVRCHMRRKIIAFIPCGHLVCCQHCALTLVHGFTPRCPLCRQGIFTSLRIYDS